MVSLQVRLLVGQRKYLGGNQDHPLSLTSLVSRCEKPSFLRGSGRWRQTCMLGLSPEEARMSVSSGPLTHS